MDNIKEILIQLKLLKDHNKILSEQISIAIQGLQVINSMGDSMYKSVADQTIKAMENCESNSSQEQK